MKYTYCAECRVTVASLDGQPVAYQHLYPGEHPDTDVFAAWLAERRLATPEQLDGLRPLELAPCWHRDAGWMPA